MTGWGGRDQQPRRRRRRLRRLGKPQKEARRARGLGAQGKPAGRRQIETARLPAHLADGKGHAAAGQCRLEDPQRIGGARRGDADDAPRIEPQCRQPRRIKLARLAPPVGLADPHNGAIPGFRPGSRPGICLGSIRPRHQRRQKARRAGAVAALRRPHFVQIAKRQPATQHGVEALDAERPQPGPRRTSRGRISKGRASRDQAGRDQAGRDRVQIQPRLLGKPPFKTGNILAQAAKHRLCAMADGLGHGRSHIFLFFICSIREQTGRRVKQRISRP